MPKDVRTKPMSHEEYEKWCKANEHERVRWEKERSSALSRLKELANAPMRAEVAYPSASPTRTEVLTIDDLEEETEVEEPESFDERLDAGFSLLSGTGD